MEPVGAVARSSRGWHRRAHGTGVQVWSRVTPTANSERDDDSRNEAIAAGASHFLTKPLDFDALKSVIADMLDAGGTPS